MTPSRRILVVDDNASIHADFRRLLGPRRSAALEDVEAALFGGARRRPTPVYQVDSAFQGEEGFRMVERARAEDRPYALAFVDMRMPPGWDGVRTIEAMFEVDDELQVVVCTAYSEYSWEAFSARFPGSDRILILKKPFDTAEVCQLAAALTEKWHLGRHAHLKRVQLEAMVAEQTAELRRANAELRASEARFMLAAAGARDGVWDWDLETGAIYFSPRFRALIGAEDERPDSPKCWLDTVAPADRVALERALREHFGGATDHLEVEYRGTLAGGATRWLLCRGLATRDEQGQAIRAAGSLTDITDRKLAEAQLRQLAFHDALTELPNRALLRERLERCILRAARDRAWRYGVIYFDLDRFKAVNDRLGHAAGDELLCQVARRVMSSVRAIDTLARQEPDPLARLGGDEFVLLLEGVSKEADVPMVAQRVLDLLSRPFELEDGTVTIGASVGVLHADSRYRTPDEVLRDADLALYHAKRSGRSRVEVFDPQLHGGIPLRWELESDMRAALGTDAFVVAYQPIVSLATGRVESVEALVRWNHPTRGTISPADFVPLAEETGLIVPLGLQVLDTACREVRRWEVQDPGYADLRLAVNVSAVQLIQDDFSADFARVVRAAGLSPARIDVEITESVLIDSDGACVRAIEDLRRLGTRVHLDDFGTGYCSLSYLRNVRVDGLKIDRSFVALLDSDPMTEHIVRAIVVLAQNLGTPVVAEGVETEAQRERLTSLGCDCAQGYLYLPPVSGPVLFDQLEVPRVVGA